MRKNVALGIIKLCFIPRSTFYVMALFSISLFFISIGSFYSLDIPSFYLLMNGIGVALIPNFGSNLWNHSNDIKEDIARGKNNVLTEGLVKRRTTIILALFLYLISIGLVFYLSLNLDRSIFAFFIIWCFVTWWYSDNLILKSIFGFRLKDHYIGELITYSIAWPSFTLSIWLIYSDLNLKGITLALIFLFYGISGLLLKDLKDISGDREAGLKTFGVVFPPSRLLYLSSIFLIFFYISIIASTGLNIFNLGSLLVVIPFILFMIGTFLHFHRKSWELDVEDYKPVQNMMLTTYASLVLFGIGGLL
ncbi:MAG: UbiA family prenyltransferase [Halobacteriota archaeon]|nr:UbiA family prenyltransferase [Halobacteriota archaeon]